MKSNNIKKQDKRIYGIDLLKSIAILGVISLHFPLCNSLFLNNGELQIANYFQYILAAILEISVPIFVLVNGFLLLGKDTIDIRQHYKKTAWMFFLFVFWSVFLIITGAMFSSHPQKLDINSFFYYFFTTGVGNPYTAFLWFLERIFAVYLLFPVIWKLFRLDYDAYKILFYITGFFTVGISTLKDITDYLGFYLPDVKFEYFYQWMDTFSIIGYGHYLFYFMLGGIINKNIESLALKKNKMMAGALISWMLIVLFGTLYAKSTGMMKSLAFSGGCNTFFTALMVLGVFCLFYSIKEPNNIFKRLVIIASTNSMGIYLIHYGFIRIVQVVCPVGSFWAKICACVLVYIMTYTAVFIVKKIPYIKKLFTL